MKKEKRFLMLTMIVAPTLTPQVQAATHAAALYLATANVHTVANLSTVLEANGGVVPNSWLPYLDAIKLACDIVELFAGPELKAIINVLLAAINAAENQD
jgi:hypothetical protein